PRPRRRARSTRVPYPTLFRSLSLTSEAGVRAAAETVIANAQRLRPKARIDGVIVQPMITRPRARELITGLARDPGFGSVIVFGQDRKSTRLNSSHVQVSYAVV